MKILALALALPAFLFAANRDEHALQATTPQKNAMELGAFSISLTVKDLAASIAFYEKLGFRTFHSGEHMKYAILKNGEHLIGLFEGMFDRNILTFNPGWDQSAKELDAYTDVRELQARLEEQGVELAQKADPTTTGPASFVVVDPDGNPVLVDQHV